MGRPIVTCKGKKCEHFRVYYKTQTVNGGELPRFELPPDQKCAHPKVCPPKKGSGEQGINIDALSKCPNE
jgi:hypothetical protein